MWLLIELILFQGYLRLGPRRLHLAIAMSPGAASWVPSTSGDDSGSLSVRSLSRLNQRDFLFPGRVSSDRWVTSAGSKILDWQHTFSIEKRAS